ncbi:unnamed protein product [Ambrosiozyma monospora]|uniref:Unnamed protein product n=1 Tax=Ambrosiozyma monospora TaxID=43982 RepID=A0ACB5T0L1_AMBMO|nr:unnamed protein product [Ambrosiozyma monospora]
MMYLLTSGRSEKMLYMQDYLTSTLDFIQRLGNELIGLVNESSNDLPKEMCNWFHVLFQSFSSLLNLTATLIDSVPLDESQIVSLTYLTINFIFAEFDLKSKSHLIQTQHIEKLRLCSSSVLLSIFKRYTDQQSFIILEVLGNLNKLPHQKSYARQFRTSTGLSVQLVSHLLVQFIQTFNISSYQFDNSYWDLLADPKVTHKKQEMISEMNTKFYTFMDQTSSQMIRLSNEIATTLINKMNGLLDANLKKVVEYLISDWMAMVRQPEFPGAETLLTSTMNTFLFVCSSEKEKVSNSVSTFCMELAGMIGSKILQVTGNDGNSSLKLSLDTTVDELVQLDEAYWKIMAYLRSKNDDGRFDYFYLKYFHYIHSFMDNNFVSLKPDVQDQFVLVENNLLRLFNGTRSLPHDYNSNDHETIYKYVLLSQDLFNQYDALLNMILKSLNNSKVKTRSRAVKQLSLLITRDNSLLMVPSIKNSLAARMNESFASVRDSIIDLLSAYLISNPKAVNGFASIVAGRISDDSLSVRKKSINLTQKLYLFTDDIQIKSMFCGKLIRRLDDEEDTICDLASGALLEMWLLKMYNLYEESQLQMSEQLKLFIKTTTEVMITESSFSDKSQKYFERFLKEQVFHITPVNKKNYSKLMEMHGFTFHARQM